MGKKIGIDVVIEVPLSVLYNSVTMLPAKVCSCQ